jgi:hypothetical protein
MIRRPAVRVSLGTTPGGIENLNGVIELLLFRDRKHSTGDRGLPEEPLCPVLTRLS